MFSVDAVLNEKLPEFSINHPVIRRTLGNFLKYLLHESEFKQFEARYPHLEGFDFVEQVLEYFDFNYRVFDRDVERLPRLGRVVIVANHPIGSLDGLALLKMVGEHRRDVKVIANEVLYAIQPLRSLLLPVDNLSNKTRKENIKAIRRHLEGEGAIIIFPAGEVSRMRSSGIKDGRWDKGFLRFAQATQSPILPLHVNGRNSLFFYALSILSKPLSGLWLVREMFKQASQHVDVRIGHLVYPEQIDKLGIHPESKAKLFRKIVYKLGKGKSLLGFEPETVAVAQAENRQLLKKEMLQCELLGETADNKKIFLYRYHTNSVIMREIGRLRELTFRHVQEGTGKRRDIDSYDHYYDHVVLWDEQELEIVGAYRMAQVNKAFSEKNEHNGCNLPPLYTQTLFDFDGEALGLGRGLELGRSFVQPRYWGKRSLDYLWFGIGAYLRKYPAINKLFGPVSMSAAYSNKGKDALVYFYARFFSEENTHVVAKNPYRLDQQKKAALDLIFSGDLDYVSALKVLKAYMADLGETIPTLYKQYAELSNEGGTQFLGFNVDPEFSDCVDGFVCVDISSIKGKKYNRYINTINS